MSVGIDFDGATLRELMDLFASEVPRERANAACAIGDRLRARELDVLGAEECGALAQLLEDATKGVRFEAAMALAEAHDRRATQVLLDSLSSRRVRLDATRALGTLGDPAAVEPLARIMDGWLMPWADRLQAAAALCALGDARGAQYLVHKVSSRRSAERAAAVHFVAESRHPEARARLEALLADPREPLRDVAARSLGLLEDPATRPALEAALTTAEGDLAEDLREALARLGRKA
ncbi:MAG: HEAT repeat domain-containing protein [Myxococcota bacterium]